MPFSFFKGNNKNQESIETPKDDRDRVEEIAVSLIVPNRNQPRKIFSRESIGELAETIQDHGLLQPIILRKCSDGKYEIIGSGPSARLNGKKFLLS